MSILRTWKKLSIDINIAIAIYLSWESLFKYRLQYKYESMDTVTFNFKEICNPGFSQQLCSKINAVNTPFLIIRKLGSDYLGQKNQQEMAQIKMFVWRGCVIFRCNCWNTRGSIFRRFHGMP